MPSPLLDNNCYLNCLRDSESKQQCHLDLDIGVEDTLLASKYIPMEDVLCFDILFSSLFHINAWLAKGVYARIDLIYSSAGMER